mgnify:CR=1 FL=1
MASATDEIAHFRHDGTRDLLSLQTYPGRFAEPYGSSKTVAELHGLRAGRRSDLTVQEHSVSGMESRTWISRQTDRQTDNRETDRQTRTSAKVCVGRAYPHGASLSVYMTIDNGSI